MVIITEMLTPVIIIKPEKGVDIDALKPKYLKKLEIWV